MSFKFCSLSSGSNGNCHYIETNNVKVLVDAGLSGKKIEQLLLSIDVIPNTIDCILVTHEHRDHVKGVGVLSRRYNIPIYANEGTWNGMEKLIGNISNDNIKVFHTEKQFELRDLGIYPFKISHDAQEPVGYCIYYKNKKISIITDTGWVTDDMIEKIKNSSLYLIESNHDIEMLKVGRYPWYLKKRIMSKTGHLSNEDAGKTLCKVLSGNGEKILLAHLSKENNFPELAYKTVYNLIENIGISVHKDVILDLTNRGRATKIYKF